MARLELTDILRWTGGRVLSGPSDPSVEFAGLSTDTRTIGDRSLFLALRGQTHDGHRFLAAAAAAGARGVLIADPSAPGISGLADDITVILTPDTLQALQAIAAGYRRTLPGRVIGISGSVGKTSTRQMVAACLQPALQVHQTAANLNNEIGLPLTLLQASPADEAIVLEMGMRGLGEISLLSRVAQPDMAMLTCIGYSHIGRLGSKANILAAKTEIIDGLRPGGLLILNADDPLLLAWGRSRQNRLRLAWTTADAGLARDLSQISDFAISAGDSQSAVNGCRFTATLHIGGHPADRTLVDLPFPGDHQIQNTLFGLAAAHECGVPLPRAAAGAAEGRSVGNRQRLIERGGLLIMDDSYNASPESMLAALRTLAGLAGGRRVIAALGCMLELGDYAETAHRELGAQAAASGVARLLVTGPHAASILAGARAEAPDLPADEYPDNLALAAALIPELRTGDCLLVKGSRGFAMEKVTEAVLKHLDEMENVPC